MHTDLEVPTTAYVGIFANVGRYRTLGVRGHYRKRSLRLFSFQFLFGQSN